MRKTERARSNRTSFLNATLTWPDRRESNPEHVRRLTELARKRYPGLDDAWLNETVRLVGNYISRCMGKPKVSFTEKS